VKVQHAENNVHGSQGLGDTANFKIQASRHAFKILSSGLYSDKITAVLREIGCNAMDAHIAADQPDRPFLVKLPNDNDPNFYIQDWGTGLSHEDVMELYSTYFASTKQTSNDFTGAFGLGSKSPFSYTDSISIVSCHDGKMRTYASYIDNQGNPVTSLMTEEEAQPSWPTGLRVSFAVRPGDYGSFQEKAQQVYRWFRVTPIVRGGRDIVKIQPTFERGVYRKYGTSGRHVLMGNVLYPLDLNEVKVKDPGYQTNTPTARDLLNYISDFSDFVLAVSIGDVEVAASREQLQYSPGTVDFLQTTLRGVVEDLTKETLAAVHELLQNPTWENRQKARKVARDGVGSGWRTAQLLKATGLVTEEAELERITRPLTTSSMDFPNDVGSTEARVKLLTRRTSARYKRPVLVQHVRNGCGAFGTRASLDIDMNTAWVFSMSPDVVRQAEAALVAGTYDAMVVVTGKPKHTADALAETKAIERAFLGLPEVRSEDLPAVPALPAKPSGRRGKNWVPALPTSTYTVRTNHGNTEQKLLSDLPHKWFMQTTDRRAWGRSNIKFRLFHESKASEDRYLSEHDWLQHVWAQYCLLASALSLPDMPTCYAELTGSQLRETHVLRLGWNPACKGIAALLTTDEVRKAVLALRVKGAPEGNHWHNDVPGQWMSRLVSLLLRGDKIPASIVERLRALDVMPTIKACVESSNATEKTQKKKATTAISHYLDLCRLLDVPAVEATNADNALTMDDLNEAFEKRFPLSESVNIGTALNNKQLDLIKYVLSKETKT
jgi:hypothetical protein